MLNRIKIVTCFLYFVYAHGKTSGWEGKGGAGLRKTFGLGRVHIVSKMSADL